MISNVQSHLAEPHVGFEAAECMEQMGELIRLTAPPAAEDEICAQGLRIAATCLGAQGGALFVRPHPGAESRQASSWGGVPNADLARAGRKAIDDSRDVEEPGPVADAPVRVAVPLPGDTGAVGALVLERPSRWDSSARDWCRTAARALAAALRASRTIDASRQQGETLARRNVELEALHEIAHRLQGLEREEEMVQAALDVVLEKLGLGSGWIFWGDKERGLELAACHGVADEFVRRARESGIGACLCQDVFESGRLKVARNTTECPRMPHLVPGGEPLVHACIPLGFAGGTLGVLNIANRPGLSFTPEELSFLETVGTQICMAVDKARTARAEMRRVAESRALTHLARGVVASLDQAEILAAVGDYGRTLLAVDRCALFLGDGAGPLIFAHLSGPAMEGIEPGRELDLEMVRSRAFPEALQSRRSVVIDNALDDPRSNAELARRWRVGSAILVPLLTRDRPRGVMLVTRERVSSWTRDEVELADALAGHAAVAIENARLYRDSRDALIKLQQAQYGMMRNERLAAVGTLAASLAHEVRNPLNSINLQLVLLSRRLQRLEAPARAEIAGIVETAGREIERLDGLVEEFLSLSSIDRLQRAEDDPVEVVKEVLGLLAPVARMRGITVEETLDGPLPRLRLDREKMKQVLINLVRNAIEAMPDGGTLAVGARVGGGFVEIHVADTGVGIEPGLDIFDFFTTTKRGGTGLGLPIARRIVEAHGGSLTFTSELGKGSVFRVTLRTDDGRGLEV
jgi:signal transduction histidine kinase